MANTGNTQQQINYGAAVNDGNGDPLRTAFIKTDDNFDNVWLAGPVGSNITITNNTVQVNNTNGNLILSPNGTGVIQTNSRLLPRLNNTYDFGSTTLKYRTGYFGAGGLVIDGNVTVAGNLTAGNIAYTGNVFVGDLQGSVYADDSTIMVDAVDNELFASRATISGNVSGTYFIGNGSQLTGIVSYGNANVAAYLANGNVSSNIVTTGNVSGNYFIGNGSQLTGLPASYNNSNVVALLSTFGSNTISTTGNISGNLVAPGGNGQVMYNRSGKIGASSYDFNFDESTFTLYVKSASFSGEADGTDALYVGSPGYTFLGSDIMAQITGNVNGYSQVNFQNINPGTLASGDYIITADNGTDSTYYLDIGLASSNHADPGFFGDTSSNNDAYIYVVGSDETGPSSAGGPGNLILGSTNGAIKMFVGNTAQANVVATVESGQMLMSGNIIPATSNVYSLGNATNQWNDLYVSNATIFMNNVPVSLDAGNVLTVNGNAVLTNNSNTTVSTTGNVTASYFFGSGSQLTGLPAPTVTQDITSNGAMSIMTYDGVIKYVSYATVEPASGNIAGGNILTSGLISAAGNISGNYFVGNGSQLTGINSGVQSSIANGTSNIDIATANGNATITANAVTYTFDTNGALTLPGGSRLRPLGANLDIFAGTGSYVNLITDDESSYMGVGGAGGYVVTAGGTWDFNTNGNLTAPGNVSATGNITAGNISTGVITLTNGAVIKDTADDAVAFGYFAGKTSQGANAVAVGLNAGASSQGNYSVAIGSGSGAVDQGYNSVAIGHNAGDGTQGNTAIAIGYLAGHNNQLDNTIILNASGTTLDSATTNALYINPVRNDVANTAEIMFYNTTSKEITYGNVISVTGNITGGNIITTGNVSGNTAGYAIGYRDIPQVSFTGNATIATTDAGKHFYSTQSSNYTLTIANNASQGFQVGAAITVVNQGTGTISIAQGSGVTLYLAGNASSGNRSVATFGMATIMKVATDTWFINGTGVS